MPVITFGGLRQEDEEFKIVLCYRASLREPKRETLSKEKKKGLEKAQ